METIRNAPLSSRADFVRLMHQLLNPLKPLYSEGGARLHLGETGVTYGQAAIELEAFSRPLWALAPFWLGGGSEPDFEEIYQKGLTAGADPDGTEYWGDTVDYDQCFVEMAAIACAILEVPEKVWQPLSNPAKQNLARWLNSINHHTLPGCNWLFFMVLVNLALDSVGMPCDMENMEHGLNEIDGWYVSDGWYSDGPADLKPQKDYYVPWALQYYGVLYSVFAAKRDPVRAERFRQRALEFGRQFAFWFDENGAALPFGRSLTYRFGQCAFYSACVFAGLEPLPLAVMKGIVVRNLQWWLQRPIFDRDGILTVGYCYPQFYMAERYNAPGSPYWGLKTFLVLALPQDHPFWAVEAAPLPKLPEQYAMHGADLLMQRLPDGQVNAYAAGVVEQEGHGQFPEKYAKFVYNTRFGFSASRSYDGLAQAAPDSMLAFVVDGFVFVRRHSEQFSLADDCMTSVWHPMPGITVTTVLVPTQNGHIRRHKIESSISCEAWDCGFAVPCFAPQFSAKEEAQSATAENAELACAVCATGAAAGEGKLIRTYPNTSLYSTNTVIPAVRYEIAVGETVLETTVTATAKPQ